MTRKRCTQVFTSAYNASYEFYCFQQTQQLLPKAYYYPPACLKSRLFDFIIEIEEEIEEHITGKRDFVTIQELSQARSSKGNNTQDSTSRTFKSPTQVLDASLMSEHELEHS